MQPPRNLTEAERDALVDRVPEVSQPLFRGWLDGTHQLDGDLIEVAAQ